MTHLEHINKITEELDEKTTAEPGWHRTQLGLHLRNWSVPKSSEAAALKLLIGGLASYADAHHERYESPIGDDGVLGEEWSAAVYAVRGLLNGELGGLDGGTLDKMLVGMLQREGFEK